MKSDLSAFIDDELEGRRQETVLSAVARDSELRRTWDNYHLIGDALRKAPVLDGQLTLRVMAKLEAEAPLLAPQRPRAAHPLRASLALAATAAGVALVAWVALAPNVGPQTSAVARAPGKLEQVKVAARASPRGDAASGRLQEYMIAHQTYSPANRILGGTAYVRTVSAAGGRAGAR